MGVAPTEYCTIHKKTEETVKPTVPETSTETPDNNTETEKPDDGGTEKPTTPDTEPTEPEKPSSGDTGNGDSTGDNTGNNP